MPSLILVRGGGDLATGVAVRLVRSGLRVVVTEIPQPLAVRRTVSFAEAVFTGETTVEGIIARSVHDPTDSHYVLEITGRQQIPVLVDPECISAGFLRPAVIVDGRMTKQPPQPIDYSPSLHIGLGPGFIAGMNCQCAIETRRGPGLGRVFWRGGPEADTGQPAGDPRRVLRAPCNGKVVAFKSIGDHCETGELVAKVEISGPAAVPASGQPVHSPLSGILRGLIHPTVVVTTGMKIGDMDPRDDPILCQTVSDKALAVGGGALEAILSREEVRLLLYAD
ncbi:MAG: EF2563 family selenium-dependent molybdenum hydroxylase system protein [Chloroflexi bacterium]|nr:EF2563 family selenium-dependent molybdenum hydroxylase system protein [Chloroflexota bacterium]